MNGETHTPDGLGLDKAARNELSRELNAKATESAPEETLRLEPPFPYSLIHFDPTFFDN